MKENRFYEQALETLKNNDVQEGDIINAFNKTVDRSGCSPTITTHPDGLKTSILPVVEGDNKQMEGQKNISEEIMNEKTKRISEVLCLLRKTIGTDSFCEWAIRGLWCFLQKEVLQQRMYAKKILETRELFGEELSRLSCNISENEQSNIKENLLREVWEDWKVRCTSYRRELEEQYCGEFDGFVQKLSHEDSSSINEIVSCLWEASGESGLLRQALSTIQEIWKSSNDKPRTRTYRIRKLTERECWRLMNYKDDDFNKAAKVNSATQLYKQAGNGIVVQVLMAIFLQMGIQGKKKWNEMSVEERQNLVDNSLDFI